MVINEFNPTPSFAGSCVTSATAPRNNYGGPNGVIVIEKGRNADIWAGDGPKFSPACQPNSTNTNVTEYSSVKVMDLYTGATRAVIPTGGIRRADELCYNPVSDVVLIANDDPLDNFITFIGEDSYQILQKIYFNGKDPKGNNILANGIEQCDFNPRDGKFYINIPNTGATTLSPAGPGLVLRISGSAPFQVEAVFPVGMTYPGCYGASGLKVGPDHQIGLGCSGPPTGVSGTPSALIIDDRNGNAVAGGLLAGENGADEIWYDPGSNHYFFGISTPGVLGVVDAGPPPSIDSSKTTNIVTTASGSHSVAADPIRNQVYVPIRAGSGTVCSSAYDAFGNKGNDALGCIAVYTAPGNYCMPEGMPIIAVNNDGFPIYLKQFCQ